MKLRKAIKLAAAGAVVGATPMLAQATAPFDVSGAAGVNMNDGSMNFTCPAGTYSCDTSNAITDSGFYMVTVTNTANGDTYYLTSIADNATSGGEGVFGSVSLVGEETNTTYNGGVWNKTQISELGTQNGVDDDFKLTATITTGTYETATNVGAYGSTMAGHQRVGIDQTINDAASFAAFNTGFTYTNGTLDGTGNTYETFDINLAVNDGSSTAGGSYAGTFQLLENKVDGATGSEAALVGLTLRFGSTVNDQTDTADTFFQQFVHAEAFDSAVAYGGTITGPIDTATFAAGDGLAATTIQQTMNGAAANFSLSDFADETSGAGFGNDAQDGSAPSLVADYGTNPGNPFAPLP